MGLMAKLVARPASIEGLRASKSDKKLRKIQETLIRTDSKGKTPASKPFKVKVADMKGNQMCQLLLQS